VVTRALTYFPPKVILRPRSQSSVAAVEDGGDRLTPRDPLCPTSRRSSDMVAMWARREACRAAARELCPQPGSAADAACIPPLVPIRRAVPASYAPLSLGGNPPENPTVRA
jgi:hypothetical protein